MVTSRGRGKAIAAVSMLLGLACSEPFAPFENAVPPEVITPLEIDSVQVPVGAENRIAGDPTWRRQGRTDPTKLALWASPYVASVGDTLDLYVHSLAAKVSLQVYRLGWYGGAGARLVHSHAAIPGGRQPPCTNRSSGLVACHWRRSTRLVVPHDWAGGIYLLKVRDGAGRTWSYPFVLRSRQLHRFTAVVNQFTWQAYNKWGRSSFYSIDPATSVPYPKISFDRPYLDYGGMTVAGSSDDAGESNGLPAIRWLESQGYDLGYLSDVDLAERETVLPDFHALLFIGHDEYWTWTQFDRVEALRNAGTHLAFLAANNAYWNIRLAAGPVTGRAAETLICYKYQTDPEASVPEQTTTRFRDPPLDRPEAQLVGPLYRGLLPSGANPPMVSPPDNLMGPNTRAFAVAAGLSPGDTLVFRSGKEGDEYVPGWQYTPPGTQMLLQAVYPMAGGGSRYLHSTFYIAPSGAGVWATGTNRWASYLDSEHGPASPKVAQLTRVILDWMDTH